MIPDWARIASDYWTAQGVSIATQQALFFIGCLLLIYKAFVPRREYRLPMWTFVPVVADPQAEALANIAIFTMAVCGAVVVMIALALLIDIGLIRWKAHRTSIMSKAWKRERERRGL